jgi:2-polyprenyl-6-methoxyphenol hydroxylase-like FAD-dependent oxidoreductase
MNVTIVGGGICGLGAALLLTRDGHDVTVLERDADSLPARAPDAWESWTRAGVVQFRQPHNFMPGLRLLLESELPDIQEALPAVGAVRFDMSKPLPPFFADQSPRPIDEKFWTYTGRRPVLEWVFADAIARERGVTMRRGVRVAALLTAPAATTTVPRVCGVRTTAGEEIRSDLVIDATGRQSRSPDWMQAIGARQPIEVQSDSGFAYYTRFFRGREPEKRASGLTHIGTISLLTLPGDNETWSVTVFGAAGDRLLKALRHQDKWSAVVRACPLHAHWLDGEAITDVLPMAGIVDRYRRFIVDGQPVATGFAPLADAWACTNPSAGRGLAVGFLHAREMRNALREAGDDPDALVRRIDERTESAVSPWYHAQIAADRMRFEQMNALGEGRAPQRPSDSLQQSMASLLGAMPADPDLYRAFLEYATTITPVQEILKRPEVGERIVVARERMKDAPPMTPPGPNRQQLADLLT